MLVIFSGITVHYTRPDLSIIETRGYDTEKKCNAKPIYTKARQSTVGWRVPVGDQAL